MLLALAITAQFAVGQVDDDPWLAPDKTLHFSLSAGLAVGAYAAATFVTDDQRLRFVLASGVALAAGAAKELADLAGLGHPSWRDFAWDLIGTFTGALTALLLDHLLVTPLLGQIPVW